MKIKWIGQAGYILTDGNTTICIDPYLSDVVNRVANRPRTVEAPFKPEELKADAVICTHNHIDHIDIDAIPYMDNENITFYAPLDGKEILRDLGVKKYVEFDVGTKVQIGSFEIEAVFAEHTVPAIGVVIRYDGNTLYFTGDTLYNERIADVKCDILFICINGRLGNMNAAEAVRLTKMISPNIAVPNHYDMFESNSEDPHKYTDYLDNGFIMEFNREYEVRDKCLI